MVVKSQEVKEEHKAMNNNSFGAFLGIAASLTILTDLNSSGQIKEE